MAKRISKRTYNPYLYGRRNYFDGLSSTSTGSSFLGRPQWLDSMSAKAWNSSVNTYLFGTYGQNNNPQFGLSFTSTGNTSATGNTTGSNPGEFSYFGAKGNTGRNLQMGATGITAALSASGHYNTPGGYDGTSKDLLDLADPMYHLAGGRESAVGNGLSDAGKGLFNAGVSSGNPWLMLAGGIAKAAGGLTNSMFGYATDEEGRKRLNNYAATLNNVQLTGVTNDEVAREISGLSFGGVGLNRKKYKNGWFNHKGTRAYENDILKESAATSRGIAAVNNAITNADTNMDQNIMANYAAYGGPIGGIDALGYMLATDSMYSRNQAMQAGNSTGLYMQPTYRQLPTFSRGGLLTARRRAFGGELNTQGGDFTNGMVQINAGGSHESNPFQGVPMGVDQQGVPNLVEEGEVIFNDYVFSRRLAVPKAIRDKYKLRSTKKVTFADAIKKLAKESEERPNDPISQNGLDAIVSELASAQEAIKSKKGKQFSQGGHLFTPGGYLYNNSANGEDIVNHAMFAPFYSNGSFDFDAMYANNSAYRAGLDPIAAALYKRKQDANYQYNDAEARYLTDYMNSVNAWNPNNKYSSINDLQYDRIIGDSLTTADGLTFSYNPNATNRGYALDRKRGGHHFGVAGAQVQPAATTNTAAKNRYIEYGSGNLIEDYFEGRNDKGQTWFDLNPGYSLVDKNGTVRDPIDEDGVSTTYTDYFLKKAEPETPEDTEDEEEWKPGKYSSWLRYAPVVGFGISAITDAAGWTNKPDYSNADAVMEAAQSAGTYNPVSFKPIGNYLTYRPFDRDYYINKMNAEAGAARRNIMNTSGGNRAQAMAGILAADNNYLNQLGSLARQAEEYNFAQRAQVEEFNRGTNTTNSQGFLQADLANQKAAAEAREMSLKGTMAAAEMRDKAKLASDAAKNANLSGLFQTLGDIGFEGRNMQMMDYALGHGLFGTGAEDGYTFSRGKRVPKKKANTGAEGGIIKRKRKGLTF